jgi:RNAse (barnase) inhibitor barstar
MNGYQDAGVYWLDSTITIEEVSQFSTERDLSPFYIDGETINDKESFLKAISSLMQFPDYFQLNWDSFEECMLDKFFNATKGCTFFYQNCSNFLDNKPEQWETALEVLDAVVKSLKQENIDLIIFLQRPKVMES